MDNTEGNLTRSDCCLALVEAVITWHHTPSCFGQAQRFPAFSHYLCTRCKDQCRVVYADHETGLYEPCINEQRDGQDGVTRVTNAELAFAVNGDPMVVLGQFYHATHLLTQFRAGPLLGAPIGFPQTLAASTRWAKLTFTEAWDAINEPLPPPAEVDA